MVAMTALSLHDIMSLGTVSLKTGRPTLKMAYSRGRQVGVDCWLGAPQESWVGNSGSPQGLSMDFLASSQSGGQVPKVSIPRKPDKTCILFPNIASSIT